MMGQHEPIASARGGWPWSHQEPGPTASRAGVPRRRGRPGGSEPDARPRAGHEITCSQAVGPGSSFPRHRFLDRHGPRRAPSFGALPFKAFFKTLRAAFGPTPAHPPSTMSCGGAVRGVSETRFGAPTRGETSPLSCCLAVPGSSSGSSTTIQWIVPLWAAIIDISRGETP